MTSTTTQPAKTIVIIGGGIIGCTSAYYLSRHRNALDDRLVKIVLLEANHPASGASGKAGGLVARWAYPRELVDVSFEEHKKLAGLWDGSKRWGWREVECGSWHGRGKPGGTEAWNDIGKPLPKVVKGLNEDSVQYSGSGQKVKQYLTGHPDDLNWVDDSLTESYEPMSDPGSGGTAQVHPYLFTNSMLELALERGNVQHIQGRVTKIEYEENGKGRKVKAVKYVRTSGGGGGGWPSAPVITTSAEGFREYLVPEQASKVEEQAPGDDGAEIIIDADQVLLAAGPWSGRLLPRLPIAGVRGHSITVKSPLKDPASSDVKGEREGINGYALFTRIELPSVEIESESPEIYARPNDEVYICGGTDEEPLPPIEEGTKGVDVDQKACQGLFEQVSSISPVLARGEVTARQACYLPAPTRGPRGSPIIGEVSGVGGLFIATGHTCWGICNAPGTAKVISELMLEGKSKSCRVHGMLPERFMN